MTDAKSQLPLWPFITADAFFVGLAYLLLRQGHNPLLWWEAMLLILCTAGAAVCGLIPFLRRDEDDQALAQARLLADSVSQLQKLDQLAAQIVGATNQWREYQLQAAESVATAKAMSESVAAEAGALREFLQKVNDSEKAHLRVEAEKLRRAEADWLHVVIHILDHVFALHRAACRSGQPALAGQIGQFQNSCREAARRIGLAPMLALAEEPFDPKLHQLRENEAPGQNALVGETLAPGYSFQGQLVRRALVALQEPTPIAPAEPAG
jgi:molecular chaperone GrpE (heat shock protein)